MAGIDRSVVREIGNQGWIIAAPVFPAIAARSAKTPRMGFHPRRFSPVSDSGRRLDA
jgi:hypothetical protein